MVVVRAVGMDVHRDFCEVAIAEARAVRSAGRIETSPEALELFASSLGPGDRVALEVTGNAGEIARILRPHVGAVVVVSPHDTGISRARAKTDRLDARALAKLLAAGELDAVWMPDEWTRAMRRRLARRSQLVLRAHAREERDPRRLDPSLEGPPAGHRRVRCAWSPVAVRARVARRRARDDHQRPAAYRLP